MAWKPDKDEEKESKSIPLVLHVESCHHNTYAHTFLCDSVVEHCVSSAKGCGFDSQGTHILIKKCIT